MKKKKDFIHAIYNPTYTLFVGNRYFSFPHGDKRTSVHIKSYTQNKNDRAGSYLSTRLLLLVSTSSRREGAKVQAIFRNATKNSEVFGLSSVSVVFEKTNLVSTPHINTTVNLKKQNKYLHSHESTLQITLNLKKTKQIS